MALDFSGVRDEPGSAIYFMHDGTPDGEKWMAGLMTEVMEHTKKQCVMFDIKGPEGRKIVDFYDLRGTHMVVIIRDDDQLHKVWADGERFDAGQIAYVAERAG